MAIKYTNKRKIFRMTIKYASSFHSKAVQNLPKLFFLFENKPSGNPGRVLFNEDADLPNQSLSAGHTFFHLSSSLPPEIR
jgi:hypothetical protein